MSGRRIVPPRTLPVALYFSLACAALPASAQLHRQIERIAAQARGRVGVACALPGAALDCDLHASEPLPMQSVYKLPIAVATLRAVEQHRLTLTQTIHFVPSQLVARDGYSPLRDQHPRGAVDLSVQDLIRRAMVESDNVASDVLLQAIGGPAAATASLRNLGISGISIMDNEDTEDRDERLQYRNAAQPGALVALLRRLADDSPLTPDHTRLLLGFMTANTTGGSRLRAMLPPGTPVADKTGTAGQYRNHMNATNDAGLITLPDGRRLAVAVLVTDSAAPFRLRERVIAEIGQAIYAAATR